MLIICASVRVNKVEDKGRHIRKVYVQLIRNLGAKWGFMFNIRNGRSVVSLESWHPLWTESAPGPLGANVESRKLLAFTGFRTTNRLAGSELLYRMHYPVRQEHPEIE